MASRLESNSEQEEELLPDQQNLIDFFQMLLEIDRRVNPEIYIKQ